MKDWAAKVIDKIIRDLSDRRGIGDEWAEIDPETQKEIKRTWGKIVREAKERGAK